MELNKERKKETEREREKNPSIFGLDYTGLCDQLGEDTANVIRLLVEILDASNVSRR